MDVIEVLLKESNIEGSLYRVKYPPDVGGSDQPAPCV